MKSVSAGLATHLTSQTTTLATCIYIRLESAGGSPTPEYGFTEHDRDLVIDGLTYRAASGFSSSDIASSNGMDVDNMDAAGVLDSPSITEADLRAGLWDYALFRVFQVNYTDLTQGRLRQRAGRLGQVTVRREQFVAEMLGLMQKYTTSILQPTSPGCRNTLGDSRCGVNLAGSPGFTVTGSWTTVDADTITLTDSGRGEAANYFRHGVITMTSGPNSGIRREVKSFSGGVFVLQLPFPYTVTAGETYSATAGCDKKRETCRDVFSNVINFRGEPFLAGMDKLIQQGRRN